MFGILVRGKNEKGDRVRPGADHARYSVRRASSRREQRNGDNSICSKVSLRRHARGLLMVDADDFRESAVIHGIEDVRVSGPNDAKDMADGVLLNEMSNIIGDLYFHRGDFSREVLDWFHRIVFSIASERDTLSSKPNFVFAEETSGTKRVRGTLPCVAACNRTSGEG